MRLKLFMLVACIGAQASLATVEYRTFTDTKGRAIEACIVRYDAAKKKVTLRCKNKGVKTVPANIFSEADQAYIASWNDAQYFLGKRSLGVTINRVSRKNTDASIEQGAMARKYYNHGFNIKIKNSTTLDFNDVTLEYVIYYSQERHIKRNTEKEEKQGTLHVEQAINLPKKTTREIKTETVSLYTYRESGYDEHWPDLDGDVDGIMLRLSMKTASGETVTREVKYPEGLKRVWSPKTRNAQISISN